MKKLFLRLQPPVFLRRLCSFILVFVLAFGLWFGSSERVEAGVIYSGTVTLDDKEIVYYYADYFKFTYVVGSTTYYFEFYTDKPIYWFLVRDGSSVYFHYFSTEDVVITRQRVDRSGNLKEGPWNHSINEDGKHFCNLLSTACTNSDLVINEVNNAGLHALFCSYFESDEFDDLLPRDIYYFEKLAPQMDVAFALKGATASVQDGILSASWNGTTDMTINLFQNSIVDVSINYTDLDSGTTYDIQYPLEAASSDLNVNFIKPGNTYYLVTDNGFEIELSELEEDYFKTTNYVINSICLTPYYYGKDNVISDNIYIGLSSVIDIGYDSTVGDDVISDSTQVILPGTNYDPDDPFKSLYDQQNDLFQGMINGYDNSGMNQDNAALSDSLSGYDAATGAIFDSASDTLDSFSFEDNLNFSVGLVTALGFVKGFVDDFFVASGDFSVIVTVVFTLIFMSMVIGIARFKGK